MSNELFFIVPESLFLDPTLTPTEKFFWAYVARWDRQGKECFVSTNELATILQCSEGHVKRMRAHLMRRNLLRRKTRKGNPKFYLTTLNETVENFKKTPCEKPVENLESDDKAKLQNCYPEGNKIVTHSVTKLLPEEPVEKTRNYSKEISNMVSKIAAIKSIYK